MCIHPISHQHECLYLAVNHNDKAKLLGAMQKELTYISVAIVLRKQVLLVGSTRRIHRSTINTQMEKLSKTARISGYKLIQSGC